MLIEVQTLTLSLPFCLQLFHSPFLPFSLTLYHYVFFFPILAIVINLSFHFHSKIPKKITNHYTMVSIGAFWNTITAFMNRVWNLIPAVPDKHAAAFWAILHLIAYVSSVVLFSYGAVYKNYLKKKELSGAAHFVERRDVWFISVGCWVVGGYCLAVIVYVRLLSVQDEQGQKCYTVLHSMDLCIGSSDRGCQRRFLSRRQVVRGFSGIMWVEHFVFCRCIS